MTPERMSVTSASADAKHAGPLHHELLRKPELRAKVVVPHLFGVLPCGLVEGGGVCAEIYFRPSKRLAEHLDGLHPGTVVALDSMPRTSRRRFSGTALSRESTIAISPAETAYFEILEDRCRDLGLKILYLQDPAVTGKYLDAINKAKEAPDAALAIDPETTAMYLVTKDGKDARSEYLKRLLRGAVCAERRLHAKATAIALSRIVANRPHTAIISIGRAEVMMHQIELELQQDAEFSFFIAETPPDLSAIKSDVEAVFQLCTADEEGSVQKLRERTRDLSTALQPNGTESGLLMLRTSEAVAHREELERKVHALRTGRITRGTPDFIGTWLPGFPELGVFEIFITGIGDPAPNGDAMFTGVIEDTKGTANCTGTLGDRHVSFIKEYGRPAISIGGLPRISYRADIRGNSFVGEWNAVSEGHCAKGPFMMRRFGADQRATPNAQ